MTRKEIIIALAAYGEATSPDTSIAHTAILIGALDRPTLPLARYHRHLEMLSKKVGDFARISNGPVPVALMQDALQQVTVRHHGYSPMHWVVSRNHFGFTTIASSPRSRWRKINYRSHR